MGEFRNTITSQSFIEKVLVLGATAALTGVAVPLVSARLDRQRLEAQQDAEAQRQRQQKLFDADLARQGSILKAQETFLEQVETTLYGFHLRAAALAWYQSQDKDRAKYEQAAQAYDSAAWDFMAKMHVAESKAQRFTSAPALQALSDHQRQWEALDLALTNLRKRGGSEEEWRAMLGTVNAQVVESGRVLVVLASDYGLALRRGAAAAPGTR
jgi:hypothetical protein